LSGELKSILINKINDFLKKHQEKRRLIEKNDLLKEFIFEKKC
jgi:tryptophanyl-tRNA synthetase